MPVAIGYVVVGVGAFTALQKHFGLTVEQKALQACEKVIHSAFHASTVEAPTIQREGLYEILKWQSYKIEAPDKPDTLVPKPIICKFDTEGGGVTYVGVY